MNIQINSQEDLKSAARQLLEFAAAEKIFLFEGDMGAGKTTFIKVICEALGVDDLVSSPTFSIVNEYLAKDGKIYHFDFYRIKDLQEAYDIGYEEYFYSGDRCLIEWPERIALLIPEHHVKVDIQVTGPEQRLISLSKI
ncbi:tRNA (adenosine(37)-N6)-threonylcarbamoyltransferase complex ATPase subunit type 1 TsaE [Pedobacter sp. SAFR-022]|jgi:tRNA threonylcarbamoyladenosine biosynthesis protein TsaE|uniref:tRNA (adenosine(37)-N6)-threonylcarbamoyltransferase complex ATPase subunit type 1 TsaE n=1 Tax=Pedobacter sp. SAFR-022 TaxID=3436861 RepID=UPI003F7EF6EE